MGKSLAYCYLNVEHYGVLAHRVLIASDAARSKFRISAELVN